MYNKFQSKYLLNNPGLKEVFTLENKQLKQRAQKLIFATKPSIFGTAMLLIVITVILNSISSVYMERNITQSDIARFYEYYRAAHYDYALQMLDRMSPPRGAGLVQIVISLIISVFDVGYYTFVLKSIRTGSAKTSDLLNGCGFIFKVLLLSIIRSLLIGLGTMAFLIPGIILSFSFSMAFYILADNPDKSVITCLRESRMMMKGNKMKYFLLHLSFIGWYILQIIPGIGYFVRIWVFPYISTTRILFYENIRPVYGSFNM